MAFDPRPRKRTVLTGGLQHPRQIPAPRTAWVIQIACKLLRALGCQERDQTICVPRHMGVKNLHAEKMNFV